MEQVALTSQASVCGYRGIKHLRVFNWLILGGFLISFVYLYMKESSLTSATVNMAVTAFFIDAYLSLPGYLLGRFSATDVKYLTVLGLASGPLAAPYSLAFSCPLCIALSTLIKLFKRSVEKPAMSEEVRLWRALSKDKPSPFVFVMSVGLLVHLIINKIIWVNL